MWVLFAVGSSFFAGITAILAKCGIRKTDSDVATAIRTVVVLLFSWLMVLVTGTWSGIRNVDGKTYFTGYTKEYVKVAFETEKNMANQFVTGKIKGKLKF